MLYELYHDKVFEFVRKRVTNPQVAEDLTGDIFEKILKSINDFQWQGITVSAWIFRIARNHVIDYYRKNNKRKRDTSLDNVVNIIASTAPSAEAEMQANETEAGLFNALRELKQDDQYLVYYKFFEELSNKQISKLTGMTETNIGTRLHRIRKKLGSILDKKQLT